MNLIYIKIARSAMITIICVGIVWFGIGFGPKHNADAKVFEKLQFLTRNMPPYLFKSDGVSKKPRKVIVNGVTTYLTTQKSRDDISSILNFYEEQYQPQPMAPISDKPLPEEVENHPLVKEIKSLREMLGCYSQLQNIRLEGDKFGILGAIEFRDKNLHLGSREYIEALNRASETGRLGEIAVGRVVIAMKGEDSRDTRIVNIWTDKDFDLNCLKPDAFGDMPGQDIEGIPRYPGNKRIFSTSQENLATVDSSVIYEGSGSVINEVMFYHSRMESEGWTAHRSFEDVARKNTDGDLLFYTKDDREVTIQIAEDVETGRIMTTVMDRRNI